MNWLSLFRKFELALNFKNNLLSFKYYQYVMALDGILIDISTKTF